MTYALWFIPRKEWLTNQRNAVFLFDNEQDAALVASVLGSENFEIKEYDGPGEPYPEKVLVLIR